jgi:hypothetical protein
MGAADIMYVCFLSHEFSAAVLNRIFDFCNPSATNLK